ncbi:uncharacterized protein BYT42DRAFT_582392 [Radiomyces spectabilis]|uniref:uncharacterized protein n=1 Tax=Radiomyces spectabilis TaxID=64574 RepID=UPI00221F4812|nr:uncharacterized protein BYT42DRAFT_582392 [Radiomyces spectabilis]KAI8370434.1 hypothetical protein BYT42DRAFT_582392 [Radiomyces spectabilis]
MFVWLFSQLSAEIFPPCSPRLLSSMHPLTFIFILANIFVSIAYAAKLQGAITTNGILTDLDKLNSATRVILNGGQYSAFLRRDGQFSLDHVAPGSYLLEVQNIDYVFPRLRVDVSDDNSIKAAFTGIGVGWDNTGYSVNHPFDLKAKSKAEYFMERQAFNVLGMFKNPMFLMLGVSGVIMFAMPKLMANMDPETMKEMAQSQSDAQKMLSDMPNLSKMFGASPNPSQDKPSRT